ncbi:MAG TPA: hypothetical protein VGD69_19100 [Herpetosiphonaceae bacterium]
MTHEEAAALEQWIKDHDTRFQATATADDTEHGVQLTSPDDGTQLPMIYRIEDYGRQHIEQGNASPTIREKWASWRAESGSGNMAKHD